LSGRPAHPAAPVIGIAAARGMDTAENHRRDASCRQKSAWRRSIRHAGGSTPPCAN